MIRMGRGEPLVLLHGVTGSERMWRHVVPLTAPHHDTIALTLLGHRGGAAAPAGAGVRAVIDDAERMLDELGLERPHLVGNSLGGWVALELARRGRARSVVALSPAGFWDPREGDHQYGAERLRRTVAMARRTRGILPLAARSPRLRRRLLGDNVAHGSSVTARDLLGLADDLLGCTIRDAVLSTTEMMHAMHPLPCPVTLSWSVLDRVLPSEVYGARARRLLPAAAWRPIPEVGHVPMLDAPDRVAERILDATGALSGGR